MCAPMDRYRIILTRAGASHILHVIDRQAGGPKYESADITISLNFERLGAPRKVSLAESGSPISTKQEGAQVSFTLRPDPVATVVLR